jgi:hypothetical protein
MKFTAYYIFFMFFPPLLTISDFARSGTQEAHTHGLATLTLALENDMLEIQFESPAANLVGFEHAAKSPEEKKAVAKAETTLKDPTRFFSFAGTHCQSKKTTVNVSGVMNDESKEHKEHGEHEHHNRSKKHKESGHSEISAEYRFSCKNPKKLISVSVALMNQFPGIEKIEAMWITAAKQGAVSLTSNSNEISLR